MTDRPVAGGPADVVEACADAFLCAVALAMQPERDIHAVRTAAIAALDRVIERTMREGARPR